ncbi:MAG: hypothetical protein K8T10_15790 [Candidatus Eremiobacteraeota bacterium]|nr:hypothetical protein [Candidatus Eremiobacteraeota bacterium]
MSVKLDGCYVIKTNLPTKVADAKTIHKRYKYLALMEKSFRIMKSKLEVCVIFVRKANRTRAHFFVAMLAYKIERYLRKSWMDFDATVSEGIKLPSMTTSFVLTIRRSTDCPGSKTQLPLLATAVQNKCGSP